ncbi:hypothetical protein B0H34DRAFT_656485 [Crassisporium funariophilum]|nr:hypothetical protein B0H34DRAFT_656485 [Crassisporium funariophilum]
MSYVSTDSCLQFSRCKNYRTSNSIRTLTNACTYKATLFTLREGTMPIFSTSLYCRGCNQQYHHNYSVHSQTNLQEYYGGIPNVVQVLQHCFVDCALLDFFATSKVFGWLSSMNCARIYNQSIGHLHAVLLNNPQAFPAGLYVRYSDNSGSHMQTLPDLQDKDILNGFFLYSLLLDHAELGTVLHLEHNAPSHKDRLKPALEEQNKRMEGIGQEEYTHACDLCFIVFVDEQGQLMKLQAAICDGDTIGHPCCAVHNCQEPLVNHCLWFCAMHSALNRQCSITDCTSHVEDGYRTCKLPDHCALETAYFQKGKAYFGRRQTHNKQLMVRPCGVILLRATFFGSESVSSVNSFAKATFPTPESTPEFLVFDNNCQLHKHLQKNQDKHFKQTGMPSMPVDVFHFCAKHKEMAWHCQLWCNPAAFPELITEDGKWQINMSVCKQTNGWVGGYQAILCDMESTRYNFYLDKLIKRRNRYTVKELIAKEHCP